LRSQQSASANSSRSASHVLPTNDCPIDLSSNIQSGLIGLLEFNSMDRPSRIGSFFDEKAPLRNCVRYAMRKTMRAVHTTHPAVEIFRAGN
jgi:hypothetical protein